MTNTQFYFALGVPFLMFIVSSVSNRASVSDLAKRIDDLSKRIDDVRSDIGGRLDRIERKLDVLDTEVRSTHERRLAVLEARVFEQAS